MSEGRPRAAALGRRPPQSGRAHGRGGHVLRRRAQADAGRGEGARADRRDDPGGAPRDLRGRRPPSGQVRTHRQRARGDLRHRPQVVPLVRPPAHPSHAPPAPPRPQRAWYSTAHEPGRGRRLVSHGVVPDRVAEGTRVGIAPLARALARVGVTANAVTLFGAALTIVGGALIALDQPLAALVALLVGTASDTLDGAIARATGGGSRLGAFLDSTADRLADAAIFGATA